MMLLAICHHLYNRKEIDSDDIKTLSKSAWKDVIENGYHNYSV